MPTTCPTHLILLDLITIIMCGEEYNLWSSSLRNFLQHCYFCFRSKYPQHPVFRHQSCSSFSSEYQVSHPCKNWVLYVLSLHIYVRWREDKRFWTESCV